MQSRRNAAPTSPWRWGPALSAAAVAVLLVGGGAASAEGSASSSSDTDGGGSSSAGVTLAGDDGVNVWRSDKDYGSLYSVTKRSGVQDVWKMSDTSGRPVTGKDVGVALIDSGVAPVPGLDDGGVINGPDLSFESQNDAFRYLDSFGHGTHMAGIISGRDLDVKAGHENDSRHFVGVAPDAPLLSLKVATADGATDVSQVIAAIDWVVQHRDDPGLHVRVLNLSFGTDGTQSYEVDPLAFAVENAWRKGIVVVAAAGNDGNDSTSLTNPAFDPYIIAVGAADSHGTDSRKDDTVATFSSRGSDTRGPDLLAPGRSIVSLRVPNSTIDQDNPSAVVTSEDGPTQFRGSGTSQAAAFVSGSVALLLQQRPSLTPDEVKRLLTTTADHISGVDDRLQGAGILDVEAAAKAPAPTWSQAWAFATGTGSLEAARGTSHVGDPIDGTELVGEYDIMGQAWDGRSWAEDAWNGRSWAGGTWNGRSWAGDAWSSTSWAGRSWAGRSWAGRSWAGRSWASLDWSDNAWTGRSWAGRSWAGRSWAGRSWAGRSWAGRSWASYDWPES